MNEEDSDINVILKNAADGDKEAFEFLYETYNPKLIKIAQMYVRKDAEDIIQNIWTKIYCGKTVLASIVNFDTWIFFVVKNHCMDFLRKHNKLNQQYHSISYEQSEEYINSLVQDDSLLERLVERQSYESLCEKITNLKEIYSLPVILHYFKGLKQAEIAKFLGISVSALKWRLNAAKILLKKSILKDLKGDN
ncbi:MAG: sigma-70 family RNA polymerase sigma factor [Oscillospiraceae bacterium]|nr:sigma-70 family RNA polymerase sigma factor [Oscillospiraceae bacterium]